MLVTEDDFYSAVASCTGFQVEQDSGETLLWNDLKLFGGEYVDVFAEVERLLGVRIETMLKIFDYIPTDSEVGWFTRLRSKRSIPDIKLRELFAHFEFSKI